MLASRLCRRSLSTAPTVLKVLVASKVHADGLKLLDKRFEVVQVDPAITKEELKGELRDGEYDAMIAGNTPLSSSTINLAPTLQVVARHGVGWEHISVEALSQRDIPLMITGAANSQSVAEHALMLMLATSRKLTQWDKAVRDGHFSIRDECNLSLLFEKRVLVVGYGRTGTRVAKLCAAFGMQVTVCDPNVPPDVVVGNGFSYLDDIRAPLTQDAVDVLSKMDYLSLHLPALPYHEPLLKFQHFLNMKNGAFVVNVARGSLVDEDALLKALQCGSVAGAGLDVFAHEPPTAKTCPLLAPGETELNVIVSPHAAPNTRETSKQESIAVARNILDFFDGRPFVGNCVNRSALAQRLLAGPTYDRSDFGLSMESP